MSLIANGAGEQPTGFYNGVATQSLRFDDGSVHKLNRTFSGDYDNAKKMTISVWAKRANLSGSTQVIVSTYPAIRFVGELSWRSDNKISFDPGGNGDGSSNSYTVQTTSLFRDVSSWYHIVLAYDTTQGTDTNRVKIYVNGTQQTLEPLSGSHTFPPEDYLHTYAYNGANNEIGNYSSAASGALDGYLAEFNFVDGLALAPSSFGETKNGVWIPIEYTGSYGGKGYRLQFDQVGVGTASTSTIGADTSGNTNHWTSSGIVASDCAMPDSPENNFCTTNGVMRANITKSEGNLKMVGVGGNYDNLGATFAVDAADSEGWYWEYRSIGNDESTVIGFADPQNAQFNQSDPSGSFTNDGDGKGYMGNGNKRNSGSAASYGNSWTGGDILGIAVKSGAVYFYKNGTIQASGAAAYSSITGLITPAFGINGTHSGTANFGQDSSFAGTETAQGNTDGNGIGDFYYAPPSGYKALCSANLEEPTIGPNSATQADDYFNSVLYTGNGGTLAVDGFGHQPDLLWIKSRNITGNHRWTDSSRGVTNNIISNSSDAEKGSSDAEDIDSFDTDGFTVTQASYDDFNDASDTYVAWSWKANGGTTVSVSESGNNPANVRQTNVTAGFSIITYTGTGAAGTIAHGLGVAPKAIITKKRNASGNWASYFGTADVTDPQTDALYLDLTDARTDSADFWNDTAPTASVYSIQDAGDTNTNDHTYVAYVFAEVEGYSKIGSYTGNGSTDGAFVFTGFKPAWVMVKRTDSANNWVINDSTRTPSNEITGSSSTLYADVDGHEGNYDTNVDFLSNGFKARTTGGHRNASGGTYIYMAFAEAPFKYANAR